MQIIYSGPLGSLGSLRIVLKIDFSLSRWLGRGRCFSAVHKSDILIYLLYFKLPVDVTIQNVFHSRLKTTVELQCLEH